MRKQSPLSPDTPNALTPTATESAPARAFPPSGHTPTTASTAALIAELQGGQVSVIENALVSVRAALDQGDASDAKAMLIEQAALLQALSVKLFRFVGGLPSGPLATTYLGLGLRAIELSRKSLAAVGQWNTAHSPTPAQTNLQVNIAQSNELLD